MNANNKMMEYNKEEAIPYNELDFLSTEYNNEVLELGKKACKLNNQVNEYIEWVEENTEDFSEAEDFHYNFIEGLEEKLYFATKTWIDAKLNFLKHQ